MNIDLMFRRLVYWQVVLGVVSFSLAEGNLGVMVVALALVAAAWQVVERPGGRSLPRWAINLGAVASVLVLFADMRWQEGREMPVLVAMGHFTMWLQVLELLSRKTSRDYAHVLMLSVLQMIGATVLSVTMAMGLMMALYSVLALCTILLFQMKATADAARAANRGSPDRPDRPAPAPRLAAGAGARRDLRWLVLRLSLAASLVAAVVFIALPRTSRFEERRGIRRAASTAIGFTETVQLGSSPTSASEQRARQDYVFNVRVQLNGKPLTGGHSFLLRGAVLDEYDPQRHIWVRSEAIRRQGEIGVDLDQRTASFLELGPREPVYEIEVTLRSSGSRVLFTLHPIASLRSEDFSKVIHNVLDNTFSVEATPRGSESYTFTSPVDPYAVGSVTKINTEDLDISRGLLRLRSRWGLLQRENYAIGWAVETSRFADFARQSLAAAGLSRNPAIDSSPDDERIARALAERLSSSPDYRYALDNPPSDPRKDPIAEFLFERRQGHCELYAASLAALCRSVGMRARMVTGYRVSEYNAFGGYYVVRGNHAHAWTEVFCDGRWLTFDATPAAEVAAEHRAGRHLLSPLRDFYDIFEIRWLTAVVGFDKEIRDALLATLETWFELPLIPIRKAIGLTAELHRLWRTHRVETLAASLALLALLLAAAPLLARLRRRPAARLQLAHLPKPRRRVLEQTLAFYLAALDLVERHGFTRPPWQSPRGFAHALLSRQGERFEALVELTEHFYEVRYGQAPLDPQRRLRVHDLLQRLRRALA